jgi:CRP-like cAMP-binding protein
MHQTSSRISAKQPAAGVRPELAGSIATFRGATVTRLGDYARRGNAASAPDQNRLLRALPAEDYARLLPHLECISLPRGKVLHEARSPVNHACFPTAGIVSTLHEMRDGTSVEAAVTGDEGMVGIAVVLGGGASAGRVIVRNAGHGYRIRADVLSRELDLRPALRQVLLRYAQSLLGQMAQTGLCHGHHSLADQLCRLLLSSMDRLGSDEVALTQDAIANLLGVRRESITAAAGKLQAAGLIQYRRGRIMALDRAGLEAQACECYAAQKAELDRLVPSRRPSEPHLAPMLRFHGEARATLASSMRTPVERLRSGARSRRDGGGRTLTAASARSAR